MRNRVFVFLLLIFLSSASVLIVLTPGGDFSYVENRPLVRIPKPTVASWKDTSFQTTLESALSDQWPASEVLKTLHGRLGRLGLGYTGGVLGMMVPSTRYGDSTGTGENEVPKVTTVPHISPLGGNVFTVLPDRRRFPPLWTSVTASEQNTDTSPPTPDPQTAPLVVADPNPSQSLAALSQTASFLRTLQTMAPQADYSLYYIETSIDIDFPGGAVTHAYSDPFLSALEANPETTSTTFTSTSTSASDFTSTSTSNSASSGFRTSRLSIDNIDTLRTWFYRTDHHWNAAGQLQGYTDILRLLKGEAEPLVDCTLRTLPNTRFSGSRARSANDFTRSDPFDLLAFSLPEHEILLDGTPGPYGNRSLYLTGSPSTEIGFNHYGWAHGPDRAEVTFHFPGNAGRGNLLVFSESYANPLKPLIASHFETARFIDVRHYANTFGHPFDLPAYMVAHDIDQVLVMGSFSFMKRFPEWMVVQPATLEKEAW